MGSQMPAGSGSGRRIQFDRLLSCPARLPRGAHSPTSPVTNGNHPVSVLLNGWPISSSRPHHDIEYCPVKAQDQTPEWMMNDCGDALTALTSHYLQRGRWGARKPGRFVRAASPTQRPQPSQGELSLQVSRPVSFLKCHHPSLLFTFISNTLDFITKLILSLLPFITWKHFKTF